MLLSLTLLIIQHTNTMPPDIDITKELHKARRRSTMTPSEQVIADVASMGVHHAPVGKFHNVFE